MAMITFQDLPSTTTPLNAANLNNNFSEILNLICPVGKVEVFFDNNDHSNYLGFTWERTLVGRTPVGIDTTQTEFDTIGETGGSKYLQAHNHVLGKSAGAGSSTDWAYTVQNVQNAGSVSTENAGTGNSGNLQPYQVVAFWKRTA